MKLEKCCKNCEHLYLDTDIDNDGVPCCEFDCEQKDEDEGKDCVNFSPNGADYMSDQELAEYGIIRLPPIILSRR